MSDISGVSGSSIFATSATNTFASLPNTNAQAVNPFANLNLTPDQQQQIAQIFQNAQTQGLTPAQVQNQVNAVLTPAQQSQLKNDLQARHHHHHGGGGGSNTLTQSEDTDAWGIPLSSGGSSAATQSLSNLAAQFALQQQLK
jgi:Spy/CpxP family protein refolding chaperone